MTTAQTLFWKPVPVLLKQAEREDQHEPLIFRILTGVSRGNHNMRVGGWVYSSHGSTAHAKHTHAHARALVQQHTCVRTHT